MMYITALPTWLLNKRLPAEHRFRGYSLKEWAAGQTPFCKQFDAIFWMFGLTLLFIAVNAATS